MQPNRFFWLFFLLLAANAAVYFPSCQRDADQPQVKPLSDWPVTERACSSGECECTVTTDANAVFDLCGDLPQSTTSCTACGSSNKTGLSPATFLQNEPRTFCVSESGEFCISYPLATSSGNVGITVQFGSSTPVNVTISPGQTICFNTDGTCSVTSNGCN